jgi:hypothetical protein
MLMRTLVAGLRGPARRGQAPLPRGATEMRLLEALDLDGCPVCRVIDGADERHLFWFLHENFAKSGYPKSWTESLGFCSGHGESLLGREGARLRIATTHRALLRQRRAHWQREASSPRADAGRDLSSCPACAAQIRAAREAASTLLVLLRQPDVEGRCRERACLCLPHLRLMAPDLGRNLLERLLLARERAAAQALTPEATLRLVAGDSPAVPLMPGPAAGAPPSRLSDPTRTLLRDLEGAMACPVCLNMRRAWLDWLEEAGTGEARAELPLCSGHLWSAVQAAGPAPARRLSARSLETARSCVQAALHELADAAPASGLMRRMWGVRLPENAPARDALMGKAVCALCQRLETAESGTLLRLFDLLQEAKGRAAFERGYGLCVRHAASALALRLSQRVRACLWEIEDARLAALEREVAEFARKSNWHARHEPMGAEASAAERALRRFSGFLCAPLSAPSG